MVRGGSIIAINMVVVVIAGILLGPRMGALVGFVGTLLNAIISPAGSQSFEFVAVIPHTIMGYVAGLLGRVNQIVAAFAILVGHGLNIVGFLLVGLLPFSAVAGAALLVGLATVQHRTTALIVVDMQNDFVKRGGALVVETAAATIPAIQRLLALARAKGMKVFFTQDTHEEGDIEFPLWGPHVLRGTWGLQIVDELAPRPGERVIEKLRYDGFFGTPLDHELRLGGIQPVIVSGTVANIWVLPTP